MEDKCKYYNPHLDTIKEYVGCLYHLEGCSVGGLLHILLDDDNIEDEHICWCLGECLKHPEREESKLGQLICEEYLKLSMQERRLLCYCNWYCLRSECNCKKCYVEIGDECEE